MVCENKNPSLVFTGDRKIPNRVSHRNSRPEVWDILGGGGGGDIFLKKKSRYKMDYSSFIVTN